MAWWPACCRSEAFHADEGTESGELPGVVADAGTDAPEASEAEETQPEVGPEFGMEVRICPVSGLSTLQGACPFAKPKAKAKDGGKKQKASVKLDFKWKQDESMVVIKVCAHHTDAFTTMELPNSASQEVGSASQEEIKKQYKALSLIHHPDKNQDDVEAATERFQRIKDAYALIKDTDGELAFPWDQHPEKQQVMKGDEAVAVFAEVGLEACEEHHFQGLQLRHLVKSSEEVKVLKFDKESEGGHITECWLDAICAGSPHFVSHLVKVYRRDAWEYHDAK
ncbi:unnamed protein product [Durusdinium trenchii]|uniref:J domain-containing protein n=2 Tax=Durusdinium trenchii TaxID=1381693 RepID=A0ABP0K497_9DINO